MFAVAVWHWVGFLLGQCVRDQVRTIAATGLRTPSIELRAIAMLAHCASTRSALHLAACTQRDNSTMGLAAQPSGARTKPLTAARDGFSLNCAVGCEAHERAKLERVCRPRKWTDGARGPLAQERLSVDGDGLVVLELKLSV